jgi:hypothetical protein
VAYSLLPRSAWTLTPRPGHLALLDAREVEGFAVHYTGSKGRFGDVPTLHDSASRLDAERIDHVSSRGWSDIAYLAAVDQAGRIFDARGARYRSAANGDQPVNRRFGALTVLIGTADTPTSAAIEAVRWWRHNVWLPLFPHAVKVVGHRDLHSTDCPGDRTYALVKSGAFLKPPPAPGTAPTSPIRIPEAPMTAPTVHDTSEAVWGPTSAYVVRERRALPAGTKPELTLVDGSPAISPISALARTMYAVEDLVAQKGGPAIDYDRLADAVVARLPQGLAGALADELVRRLSGHAG